MRPLLTQLARLRRRVLLHRRILASVCAGLAVLAVVQVLRPPPPPTVRVWVAARDLPAGAVLTRNDVRRISWPRGLDLRGVEEVDDLLDRTVAVPLQRGQPVSDASLLGEPALAGHPGRAAVAVRIPDPDVADLLAPGDEIDLWLTDPRASAEEARQVVEGARVVAVPEPESGPLDTAGGGGRVVVLAVADDLVGEVAAAAAEGFLSVAWSR